MFLLNSAKLRYMFFSLMVVCLMTCINTEAQTAREHLERGIDAYNKKLFDNAIIELDAALSLDSTLHEAYFYRGLSFGNVGSFEDAVPDFQYAVYLQPQRDDYWVYLGMGYDIAYKDKANALICFNKAIGINQKSKEAYFRRAVLYLSQREDVKACSDLSLAQQLGHEQAPNFVTKYCQK